MQKFHLKSGDIITARSHKRPLQVAWGDKFNCFVCRVIKRDGRPGLREVIVHKKDVMLKELNLL